MPSTVAIALSLAAWLRGLAGFPGVATQSAVNSTERRIVVESARLASGETADLLVLDGVIASIGAVESLPGDVVVRARGGEVIAGRRRTFETIPEWSELVGGPALGLTSVVLPWDAVDRAWIEGMRSRAAWVGPRLAGTGDPGSQPRVAPGFPAEFLVLDPETRAISQAVVGDRVLRRADLETRREMLVAAGLGMAALPPPGPGLRGLRLAAAGLPIGRIDLSHDGRFMAEHLVAPHPMERSWEVRTEAGGWSVILREQGTVVATVRSDQAGVSAESAAGKRIDLKGVVGEPSIDLAAITVMTSDALRGLPVGGVLEKPIIDLEVGPEGLTLQPDTLSFRHVPAPEVPFRLQPEERGFAVTSILGRKGLVVLGSDGFPARAWETGPAGDVEWVGRPLNRAGNRAESPETALSATKPS